MALTGLLSGVFGTRHDRERKRVQPIVDEINEHYARLQTISEEELRGQTEKFRSRIRDVTTGIEARIAELRDRKRVATDPAEREGIDNELSGVDGRGGVEAELRTAIANVLDELLPEAFATAREAARRLLGTKVMVTGQEMDWNMVPYDVQLMGGIQLHNGRIAEMATGEGKTLVATLAVMERSGDPWLWNESVLEGVVSVSTRRVDVSSTEIRERRRARKSIKGFVPESVERFIEARGLYR